MQGKMPKSNSCKEKYKERIHGEGRYNCDFYLIYKICQCLLKIFLIQNITGALSQALLHYYVILQKRVRVFQRGFKHEKTDESTRPQAECICCFRVFETPMKHEARDFEITSLTRENNFKLSFE